MPVRVVTVSRQFGSGGAEFAARLGAHLGWPVHDRFISEQAAERLAAPPESVTGAEEREASYLERLERFFAAGTPETIIGPTPDVRPWNERVFAVERETILRLANEPPAIIVGRGAQCLLRRHPGTLHVRVYSPAQDRIAAIARRTGATGEQAAAVVKRMDAAREKFLSGHFGCSEREDTLYDLELNTSALSLDEAVAVVSALIQRRASSS